MLNRKRMWRAFDAKMSLIEAAKKTGLIHVYDETGNYTNDFERFLEVFESERSEREDKEARWALVRRIGITACIFSLISLLISIVKVIHLL